MISGGGGACMANQIGKVFRYWPLNETMLPLGDRTMLYVLPKILFQGFSEIGSLSYLSQVTCLLMEWTLTVRTTSQVGKRVPLTDQMMSRGGVMNLLSTNLDHYGKIV